MRFIIAIVVFLVLLIVPFVLVLSPNESLKLVTWLSMPTWPLHGQSYSDRLFSLLKPNYTLLAGLCLAIPSLFSKTLFLTLLILTTIASFLSAFWLNYLMNAA